MALQNIFILPPTKNTMRGYFCKQCKNILPPPTSNKKIIKCLRCGLEQLSPKGLVTKEKIPKKIKKGEGAVKDENIYATYKNICKKCGFDKAEIIDLGVKYSDEDNLIFLK